MELLRRSEAVEVSTASVLQRSGSEEIMSAARSRREFLATVAGVGAATVLRSPWAWAADDVDPRVAELVASTIGVDTHNHVDVPLTAAEVPGPDLDLVGEMKRSGLSA